MIGDKVKRMCDHILSIRLTNEGTKHKAREAMEDINELLQYKEKYEELKKETDAYVLEVAQMMVNNGLDMKDADMSNDYKSLVTDLGHSRDTIRQKNEEIELLKEDAELGKALNLAMTKQQIGEIDICINDMVININTYNGVLTLEEWYNKNKGDE